MARNAVTGRVPAPPVIEMPFAERVREGLRLRAEGLRWIDIGELLGVSPDTARRYIHAHDCEGCGEPILAARVPRCRRCANTSRSRWGEPFTEREIIDAIRAWQRLEGRPPAQADWHPSDHGGARRWEHECPRWPPAAQVTRRFGSWNAALQAAGFDRPRPPAVSDEQILDALQAYHRQHGTSPTRPAWERLGLSPNSRTIETRLGSWNAALAAAGLPPSRIRRDWSDQDILDGLRRFAADHGRPPRYDDRVGLLSTYPSPALVVSRLGPLEQGAAQSRTRARQPTTGHRARHRARAARLPARASPIPDHIGLETRRTPTTR